MDLRALRDVPSWEWPEDAEQTLLDVLRDDRAAEPDLLLAAELAGDVIVISDDLVDVLLSILESGARSVDLRARAAISLGPLLEQADTQGFEDAADTDAVPVTESTVRRIHESLRTLYLRADVPAEVRRRILEASVRAPQGWHENAIRAAYASDDAPWRLTAVFCMRFVPGFDAQIQEALESPDADIRYEAVVAAGNWAVAAAWPHVVDLVTAGDTEKPLLLAAIEAVAGIRPHEAPEVLDDLADADDEDVVAAVEEALAMAEGLADEEEDEESDDEDDDDAPR